MGTGRPDEGFRVTCGSTSNQAAEFVRIAPVYNLTRLGPATTSSTATGVKIVAPIENHKTNIRGL